MLFYVDMTRQLQFVRSTDGGQTWQVQPPQDPSIWPLADTPNAPVAAATSVNASDNSASVFYISNGQFVQSIITDYNWLPYSIVQPVMVSNTTTNITAPFRSSEKDTKGIKIGASFGAIAVLFIVVIVVWFFSRKKQSIPSIERTESIGEWKESESGFGGKAELDGHPAEKFELDHDPECLLLHQLQLVRIYELKGEIPVELQNTEAPRPELDHTLCKCELDASVLCELPTSLEKEEGMSIAESSGKGKGKEVVISVTELPSWSWAILRRQVQEKDEEMGGEVKAMGGNTQSCEKDED
jgi:hypothetical protein